MLVKNDFHKVHYELLQAEKETGETFSKFMGKGSTHKIYMFNNGYGASVINGSMSFNHPELAVIYFENWVKPYRSKKKRLKKKALKRAGNFELTYSTSITNDVKRYDDEKELQRDLARIAKFIGWER